jgi:Baseplate J-like protein
MTEIVRVEQPSSSGDTYRNQRPIIDYTGRDYARVLQALREEAPRKLPEWRDFENEADFGNVMLELFAYVADILSYYQDRVANESFLSTAVTRRSVIEHLRLIGYRMRTAAPAATTLTLTIPADAPLGADPIVLHRGAAFATKSLPDKPSVRFEYARETDCSLVFTPVDAAHPKRPRIAQVPVEEGRLIVDDVVGRSDETPDQRYPLTHRGLILRPAGPRDQTGPDVTVLTAVDGNDVQRWTFRESLAFSTPSAPDFTIDIDENDRATIVFGDRVFGAIPPRGATVTATYRVGGGLAGNVPANAVVSIVDAPALAVLGAKVTNGSAATGGAERETIERAVAQAPAVFRSHQRAVTTGDYEALARSFDGVGKVRAAATGWNRVTLYVAPSGFAVSPGSGDVTDTRKRNVTDTLELGLKRFLEDKRMLTQIIEVADVDPVPIFVTADVGIESYFVADDVVAAIESAAASLLAFDKVDFGETLYLSRFYDAIQSTPGVRFAHITEFKRPEQRDPVELSGMISLRENELPVPPADDTHAAGIKVNVVSKKE